jgi:hypothetical protein
VNDYMLNLERSALCMLPPPFNFITTLAAPWQRYYLRHHGVSLAGTIADVTMELFLWFPVCVYVHWDLMNFIYQKSRAENANAARWTRKPILLLMVAFCVFPFVWGVVVFDILPQVIRHQINNKITANAAMIDFRSSNRIRRHYRIDYGGQVSRASTGKRGSVLRSSVPNYDKGERLFSESDLRSIFAVVFPGDYSVEAVIAALVGSEMRRITKRLSHLEESLGEVLAMCRKGSAAGLCDISHGHSMSK